MKILYYDCFAGISGDMNLAAMLDLGVDCAKLEAELNKLNLPGWSIRVEKSAKNGIAGTRVDVLCGECVDGQIGDGLCAPKHNHEHSHEHSGERRHGHAGGNSAHCGHRTFADIRSIILQSGLSSRSKDISLSIFKILAEAEAKVHNKPVDEVHFHEVGAVDSIIDIVGCAVCIELLGVDELRSSSVELGSGTVVCAHGVMPVPAPATAELAKMFPSKLNGASHECTTPTGAAIIAALAKKFNSPVSGRLVSCGIGIGHRDCAELPNILRVMLYDSDCPQTCYKSSKMCVMSANIDDMSGEAQAYLCESLFKAGARDVWTEPVIMKKGRSAFKVSALCAISDRETVAESFFRNSTTLGLKIYMVDRLELDRKISSIETSKGKISFKTSEFGGIRRVKAEADDIAKIASETASSFMEISEFALDEFKRGKTETVD